MFEQYLKTWDPASYNKLQKDIIRDYGTFIIKLFKRLVSEPGDSPDTISRKKLARIRVTLLRPQIELPPPKRPPHIEACDVVIINPSKATMNSTITVIGYNQNFMTTFSEQLSVLGSSNMFQE